MNWGIRLFLNRDWKTIQQNDNIVIHAHAIKCCTQSENHPKSQMPGML
jgi:hypothetical protein